MRALSIVFRAKFRDGLQALFDAGKLEFHGQLQPLAEATKFSRLLRTATRQKWVVYAKRPFPGAKAVLAYLSRYTHRVGLTNRRLRELDHPARTVTFEYKDYADQSRKKLLTLDWEEFIRRFRLHLLPARFVKIRHYGFLSNRNRRARVAEARAALRAKPVAAAPAETDPTAECVPPAAGVCPFCQHPTLRLLRVIHPHHRAPTVPLLADTS